MVFSPDKEKVAQRFRRSLPTYDTNAHIQKKVSERVVNLLQTLPGFDLSRVLEVGCCTGILTELFCSRYPVATLYINDLVPELCVAAKDRVRRFRTVVEIIAGDVEKVALPDRLDLIISSSTLQWLADFPAALEKFSAALAKRGYLVFSFFADGTLQEIRELTGKGLEYQSLEQVCSQLAQSFDLLHVETCVDRLTFSNPREVLRHLQATGVSGLDSYRWTPAGLRSFEEEYRRHFGSGEKVRLSYVSHFLVARKKCGEGEGQGGSR